MKEKQWLEATDPDILLDFIEGRLSDRKLRLFAYACCRRIWHLIPDARSQQSVLVAENYADGSITEEEIGIQWQLARDASNEAERRSEEMIPSWCDLDPVASPPPRWEEALDFAAAACEHCLESPSKQGAKSAAMCARFAAGTYAASQLPDAPQWLAEEEYFRMRCTKVRRIESDASAVLGAEQAKLIREVSGNPFRPVAIDDRWLTSTVVDIAEAIYEERAFDRMPILSDALMDAGCDSEEMITHCRGNGPHVRGCWVVDLLLGKT